MRPNTPESAPSDAVGGTNAGQDKSTDAGVAIALSIAGSDSGGGAGIQADLKTFSARGVYGASVLTALTAQNTCTVSAIHDVPIDFITEQLHVVLSDLEVRAIKVGMLSNSAVINAVSTVLREHPAIPVVLDPVMVAKSGDALLASEACQTLVEALCPLATVITPNVPEAAILLGLPEAENDEALNTQAAAFSHLGARAVLLKGGHLRGDECTDVLISEGQTHRFTHPRINTGNTHGTGCTLSAAIAAELAKGENLPAAVQIATDYLHQAILASDQLRVGRGHGPVHHFHALWAASDRTRGSTC